MARHICTDCGINVVKIGDYTMLPAEIWQEKFKLGWDDNVCLRCCELRLGRALAPHEVGFGLTPSVEGFPKSDLLRARAFPPVPPRKRKRPAKAKAKKRSKTCNKTVPR